MTRSCELAGWAYTIAMALWLVMRALFFDRFWWLALANTVAVYLFLPLVLLIPLALWCRAWPLLLGLCLPLLACVYFSFPSAGWGFGHTARMAHIPFPLLRIDYIWHTADLAARRAYVGPDVGSDHRPVIAELQLLRNPGAQRGSR